jgi:hypothetical protein
MHTPSELMVRYYHRDGSYYVKRGSQDAKFVLENKIGLPGK